MDISKNKVFQSPYKDEIEKRLAIGQSSRAISSWLKTRGETISPTTINKYKEIFFNVEAEASKIIKLKQEETKNQLADASDLDEQRAILETERNRHVATIRAVNHIAVLYQNINDMQEYLAKLSGYDPIVASHAARGIWQEIRQTIESLEKIQEKDRSTDNSSVAKILSQMNKMKKELDKK